jgi:hypothetical protein
MRQRNGTNGLGSSSSIRGSSKNLHPFLRSSHHDGLTSTGGIVRWFMGPAVCTLFSLGKILCMRAPQPPILSTQQLYTVYAANGEMTPGRRIEVSAPPVRPIGMYQEAWEGVCSSFH